MIAILGISTRTHGDRGQHEKPGMHRSPESIPATHPARVDAALEAWVLSRYADVTAALCDPRVSLHGTTNGEDTAHVTVREATLHAQSPEQLARWRTALEAAACRTLDALPGGQPVDLVRSFADPCSLELALMVTGAPRPVAEECTRLARETFLSAACATNGAPQRLAQEAAARLGRLLERPGAHSSTAADVQTFVALTQTLPCLFSTAWLALLQHPEQMAHLREGVTSMTQAVGELLRFASPSRAIFREALADVTIGGMRIRSGDRLVLMLSAANRDPLRFPDPDRLDILRETVSHLAFGAGPHRCAGASIVRMAVAVATGVLLRRTAAVALVDSAPGSMQMIGGFAICAPATLSVILTRSSSTAKRWV
ncbi:MAG: cytochrome P450 [Gemmatimonadaceae bacterium]